MHARVEQQNKIWKIKQKTETKWIHITRAVVRISAESKRWEKMCTLAKAVRLQTKRTLTLHATILRLFLTNAQSSFRTSACTSEPRRFDFPISQISSSCSLFFSPCFFSKCPQCWHCWNICANSLQIFFFYAEALRGCSQLFGPWVHFKRGKKKSWSCFLHRVWRLQPSGCAWAHLESTMLH